MGVGQTVNWPVGQAEKGNEDVLGKINQTEYSIGYVELAYAIQNKVPYGLVQNAAGSFVRADLASVTAAAAGAAEYACRFPRLHHQCSRAGRISDLELHLAVDS